MTDGDVLLGYLGVARREPKRVAVQRLAIERFVDGHRGTEFARSVHQIAVALRFRPALAHRLDPAQRFRGAQQHGLGDIRFLRDDIHAPMHAVREVNVGVAAGEIHRLVARAAQAAARVARGIVRAEVSLRLDEPRGQQFAAEAAPEHAAEKRARDADCVVGVETARKLHCDGSA